MSSVPRVPAGHQQCSEQMTPFDLSGTGSPPGEGSSPASAMALPDIYEGMLPRSLTLMY